MLIDEILGRLREQSQGYVDENTRRARLAQSFEETWRELAGMLEPLVARLQGASPHIHPNRRHVDVENVLGTSFDATGPHNEMYVCDSWAAMASFGIKHTFVSGVCVEVSNDGELVVTGGHFVDPGVYDQSPEWRTGTERAPIDTVAATAAGRNHRARQVAAARLTVEVGGTHESPRNLDSQACAQLSEQPCALTLTESHALEGVLSSLATPNVRSHVDCEPGLAGVRSNFGLVLRDDCDESHPLQGPELNADFPPRGRRRSLARLNRAPGVFA